MKSLSVFGASLVLLATLPACGTTGGGTDSATDGGSGSTGSTSNGTTPGTSSVSASQGTTEDPTGGGSMGATDSATTSPTTSPTTSASGTTDATTGDTTEGVTTQTTGEASTSTTSGSTGEGSSTTGSTSDSGGSSTGGSTGGNVEPCACPDIEVPLDDGIFVLSDNAQLWKYYPMTNQFTMLGAIGCNMPNTFSMAVDRLGFAWVMFNNPQGAIRKVDVTNPANCIDPGYVIGQQGVKYFGMAFVSNSEFDQCDSLYGNTFNGIGGFSEGPNIADFLNLDPNTLQIKLISKSNFNGAEMTGTGDGRVFSFGGVPSKLVERDKATGAVLSTLPLANLPLTNAFAFSFFGGDFYFFTESANPSVSKVTHLDYDDSDMNGKQDLTTINNAAPIRIVGAGVSTCAPFVPM